MGTSHTSTLSSVPLLRLRHSMINRSLTLLLLLSRSKGRNALNRRLHRFQNNMLPMPYPIDTQKPYRGETEREIQR